MIFSRKNAGKWVASKNGRVVATSKQLKLLMQIVQKRKDFSKIAFDRVPRFPFIGWNTVGLSTR